jgi:hypothetical protein
VLGVAHVEPENVGARVDELADHFFGFGGRAQGDDDLCFT